MKVDNSIPNDVAVVHTTLQGDEDRNMETKVSTNDDANNLT